GRAPVICWHTLRASIWPSPSPASGKRSARRGGWGWEIGRASGYQLSAFTNSLLPTPPDCPRLTSGGGAGRGGLRGRAALDRHRHRGVVEIGLDLQLALEVAGLGGLTLKGQHLLRGRRGGQLPGERKPFVGPLDGDDPEGPG